MDNLYSKWIFESSLDAEDNLGWNINPSTRKKESIFIPNLIGDKYYFRPDLITKIISNHSTDEELIKTLNIKPSILLNTSQLLIENIQKDIESFKLTNAANGNPVAKVFSINNQNGSVIITHSITNPFFKTKDKLYIIDNNEKIYIYITKPFQILSKCVIGEDQKSLINKIKLNSIVYSDN